jgi:hypothetical protein
MVMSVVLMMAGALGRGRRVHRKHKIERLRGASSGAWRRLRAAPQPLASVTPPGLFALLRVQQDDPSRSSRRWSGPVWS